MKANITRITILLTIVVTVFSLSSFVANQNKPWVVPDKFQKMANPVKSDAASLKEGKELYTKHCVSCHGKTGLGDGSKAAQLKTEPGDFSKEVFQKQSNGAMFYKISEGRDDMPSFKKKMDSEEEIWNVVNFMRTLKK